MSTPSAETAQSTCHYCGPTDRELRPYGSGGSNACFPCAMVTPECAEAAKNAFGGLLDAVEVVSSGPVMIGTDEGPVPFDPERPFPPASEVSDGDA